MSGKNGGVPVLLPLIAWLAIVGAAISFGAATANANCFGNDAGALSTDRAGHLGWASARDASEVAGNLAAKVDALTACATSDEALRAIFADLSVVIAQHAPSADCFQGDVAVLGKQRQPHLDWAASKTRQEIIDNLRWKSAATMACLDREKQNDYFADMSVAIAQAAQGLGSAPAKVVWQLGRVDIKNATPYPNVALRVDDAQADASGGYVRITALNDGECVPGEGVPTGDISQRFLFRWVIDRDISQLAYPQKFTIRFTIEADDNVPCLDLNPIMEVAVDQLVLDSKFRGVRFYWKPNNFHDGAPRVVEVVNAESGLERGSQPHAPLFKVVIWGFRGNRGMQLEATYPYTLAGSAP